MVKGSHDEEGNSDVISAPPCPIFQAIVGLAMSVFYSPFFVSREFDVALLTFIVKD